MSTLQGKRSLGRTGTRKTSCRNKTGVIGITLQIQTDLRNAKPHPIRYFLVTPMMRRFNIERLGREEAFRRAVALRAEHERAYTARMEASRGK